MKIMKIFCTAGLQELARDVLGLISKVTTTTNDAIQELDKADMEVSYDSQKEMILFKKKGDV